MYLALLNRFFSSLSLCRTVFSMSLSFKSDHCNVEPVFKPFVSISQWLVYYFNLFLLFGCMCSCFLVCSWWLGEEPFENLHDQDFEAFEHQQVSEEGKYILWSCLVLITLILCFPCIKLTSTYYPSCYPCPWIGRFSFIKSFG